MENFQNNEWPDDQWYFITTSTFLHFPYFRNDKQKQLVKNRLFEIAKKFNLTIKAYSISINHFHYYLKIKRGQDYPKIKRLINGGISCLYGKQFEKKYKEIWQGTKASIVYDEKAHWRVIGYIIGNLLKHRELGTFHELADDPFSSYKEFVAEYGVEMAKNLVYSVINVPENAEGEVELKVLSGVRLETDVLPRGKEAEASDFG